MMLVFCQLLINRNKERGLIESTATPQSRNDQRVSEETGTAATGINIIFLSKLQVFSLLFFSGDVMYSVFFFPSSANLRDHDLKLPKQNVL